MSLATKYRPKTFDEVIGQDSNIRILKKIIEQKAYTSAMIFGGSSGAGKTSTARIFANEVNQHKGSPIEIDAASNSGVDNVREIIKSANERSLDSEYKIFIIDEAHMLSNSAWNAFLKGIEEPPAFTIFIFCTTEKNKIPDTIKNRCQVFNFNKISPKVLEHRLLYVCQQEGFTNYQDACNYISKISNGQARDALANLEKCATYSTDLTMDNVITALGDFSYSTYFSLFNAILDGNEQKVYAEIDQISVKDTDLRMFVEKCLDFCIDVNKYCLFKTCDVTSIPTFMENDLKSLTSFDGASKYYNYYMDNLLNLKNMLKNDVNPLSTIEVIFGKITRLEN